MVGSSRCLKYDVLQTGVFQTQCLGLVFYKLQHLPHCGWSFINCSIYCSGLGLLKNALGLVFDKLQHLLPWAWSLINCSIYCPGVGLRNCSFYCPGLGLINCSIDCPGLDLLWTAAFAAIICSFKIVFRIHRHVRKCNEQTKFKNTRGEMVEYYKKWKCCLKTKSKPMSKF